MNSGENAPNYGKKLSEEHKQKLLQANIGRRMSEENRLKLIAANTGKPNPRKGQPISEEHKENIRKAKLDYYERKRFLNIQLTFNQSQESL